MITDIRLQNFRSYKDASFEFNEGVNIIVGPNAAGKTNLLEALLVLSSGKSYRVKDPELVYFKKPWARIDADFNNGAHRTLKIVLESSPTKTCEIDGKIYKRLSLDKTIATVLFEPNQLLILSTSPDKRREYLDDLLEQTVSEFKLLRGQYKRALFQRNTLLKKGPQTREQLFVWDVKLSQLAGRIINYRQEIITKISSHLNETYKGMSGSKTKVSIEYIYSVGQENYESQLLKKLQSHVSEDYERGFTAYGPHREDFVILFDGHQASAAASRGEIRTATLALKTIELKIIEEARGEMPLVLLDDVFSELDGRRRHTLTEYLKDYQTFITTTDADLVIKNFTKNCNVIAV